MALSDEIKERLDIVEVVSSYVPTLQRAGRNYKAPCPFHSERTPSFVVFPERQSWRCFGACATGGDVLSFVMGMENLDFSDTLKLLAQRAGVAMPKRQERQERNALHQVNQAAAAFFQELLRSQQGMAARAYLHQRGVDSDTTERFQLGLSPGNGSALLDSLSVLGYPQEQIVRAGLATVFNDAPPRDMFLGRLIFPIHDDQGNLAGFGGRSLDGSDPKYLNTPRTEVFDKGRILYAFHLAKNHIKEQGEGVVVEGYMDAIAAHQFGFDNVVASMGTALTEHQVALLRGAGKRFVLALDPDAAGQAATFRSIRDSWRALGRRAVDVSLRIAALPSRKDPDEFIRADPEAWRHSVAEATPLLDYLFGSASELWDLSTSEGKAQATEELFPVIRNMDNPFEQEKYFRRLSETLDVSLATLEATMGRPQRAASRGSRGEPVQRAFATAFEGEHRDPLEEYLLALVLRWPELREYVGDLEPDTLVRWESREIFTSWIRCSIIDELLQGLEEDLRQRVHYFLSLPIPSMDVRQREQAVTDCCHRLEERRLRNMKAEEALLLGQGGVPEETEEMRELEQRVVDTNEKLLRLFYARSRYQQRG